MKKYPENPVFVTGLLLVASILAIAGAVSAAEPDSQGTWPRFRGADGNGHGAGTAPTEWSPDSVAWAVDLPMQGHSSPIVWHDRIYLTGYTQADTGVERRIVCVDRVNKGQVVWNVVVAVGEGEKHHKMNSWATPSCATDGDRIVAFFGVGGLHCYNVDGKELWSSELGNFTGSWGVGGSPIIYNDLVIQNCDAEGTSFLVAVNKETGKEAWRTPRRSKPRGGWSTPIVVEVDGRDQIVLNGEFGVQGYDPASGAETWFCESFNGRGTPTPVTGNGLVYVVSGKSGAVYAVKPGGKGDVTKSRMAWNTVRKGGRDLPSPILVGDSLFVINMGGIATGYDAMTGKEKWKSRVDGNFSSSPVSLGDLVYTCSENGTVYVARAADKFELVAKNSVGAKEGEIFRSSMAISSGQIILRSNKRLYCVGEDTFVR